MKHFTKRTAETQDLLKFILCLKRFNPKTENYDSLLLKSKRGFFSYVKRSCKQFNVPYDELFAEKVYKRNLKKVTKLLNIVFKEFAGKICFDNVALGYATEREYYILQERAFELLKKIEKISQTVHQIIEKTESFLSCPIELNELNMEFIENSFIMDNNFYIDFLYKRLCIEDCKFTKKGNFSIIKSNIDFITPATLVYAIELYRTLENNYELHLLLCNESPVYLETNFWELIICGTNLTVKQKSLE
ncbi:MAG: hypothetical protein IJV95_01295 [Clostridia bacterium]|nr:hypothetical protein [Clostridia bacterium]